MLNKSNVAWLPFARNLAASASIESGAILELNSFSGVFCQQLAQGKAELDCIGLCADNDSYKRLTREKGTTLNVTYRLDPPTHVRYPDDTFSLIFSIFVNRLSDLQSTLNESYRLLTTDGKVLLYLLADYSGLRKDWLGVRRHQNPMLYWRLRKENMSSDQQAKILETIKTSKFGGGNLQEHGPFSRIELLK